MIHPPTFVAESVYAYRDFKDVDGVQIHRGQHLGELHRGGILRSHRISDIQAWWTQKGGRVTASFAGDSSSYVTSTQ